MRFLIFSALGLLCLAGCNSDTDTPASSGPVSTGNAVPKIHVYNATDTTHQVEVEYDHGFKTLKIAEESSFQFHFNPMGNSGQSSVNTYDVTVYEYESREKKCSTVISVAASSEYAPLKAANSVGQGRCVATTPENTACTVKAGTYGPTCQIELTISQ
jgi:hypothetical protein